MLLTQTPGMIRARKDIATDYTNERNTLKRPVKDYAPDKIELEIGDAKSDEFIPQAKIKRWDNETNFSIRRDNGARSFVERDGKVVAESADENVVIYELEPDEQNEDGGLEIEIELPRRPRTNVFEFTLQTKGLDFFYQDPLTQEEIKNGASRPENVEGSYAVYHSTKRDNRVGGKEYKTGKAFHIYRPKAIDADGAEMWCDLNIDEQAGILTVTVPQVWLAQASYPVRVDPTLGYTSIGGSGAVVGSSSTVTQGVCGPYTLSSSEDVTEISIYCYNTSSASAKGMVYEDSGGDPSARRIITAGTTVPTSPTWFHRSTTTTLSASTYWIGFLVSQGADGSFVSYYDTNSSFSLKRQFGVSYTSGSNPMSVTTTLSSSRYSFYFTYTGTLTPPTVTTQAVSSIAETTATGNGNVTDDGGATITERGVCWSTSTTPTTSNSKATATGTTGAFTASITGLTEGTTYYVRAYAINAEGTSYGSQVSFFTAILPTVTTSAVTNIEET